jgi:hypothetical protein
MGRNKSSNSAPPKGKPSGSGRESSGLKQASVITDLNRENEIADNYTKGEDMPAENVHIRHRNRNTDKGRED